MSAVKRPAEFCAEVQDADEPFSKPLRIGMLAWQSRGFSMQWFEQWRAIADRIDGLVRAAELFGQFSHGGRTDLVHVTGKVLVPEAAAIDGDVQRFATTFEATLPLEAANALREFRSANWLGGLNVGEVGSIAAVMVLRS